MSVSASRRTWEEASSPAAVRLARAYEQAWRDSEGRRHRPDPRTFLDSAGASIDEAGARLAVLRADLSLRWESGEKVGARWYLDRHADLSEDTIVALVYEEFCLREEDGEHPDPGRFLEQFPQVAPALRRVLDIHGLVGSGSTRAGSFLSPNGSGEYACAFPEAGQTISGFFLVEELGRGSFARVFLARERELADRPVALKVTRRGSREPQTLARLQHTHIVPVHSHRIDRATGLHLLCMPYFGRTTLTQVLAAAREREVRSGSGLVEALEQLEPDEKPAGPSSGRVAVARRSYDRAVAWWGARLAEALEHAHERGVLHRDIKPSNVLVTADGMPMLLDFNLAREPLDKDGGADEAAPGGTVDYMAPEHLLALAVGDPEGLDHRSDIYSLGVVLYEALTGSRPFPSPRRGVSLVDALQRAAEDRQAARPRPATIEPQVPPALDAVVRRCLEPDPADRYRTAGELAADLRAVADDLPLSCAREPLSSRVRGWLRRKRLKLMVAAVLTLALLVVTATVLVASIGFLLIKEHDARAVESRLDQALEAYDAGDYEKARLLFDTIADLADRLDRLDPRQYRPPGRGPLGTARTIVERLRGLSVIRDLDEMKALARDKGGLAARYADAYSKADALHRAADRLRFELLLELKDLPAIYRELQQALGPFYVLTSTDDWTRLGIPFGLLDDDRKRQLVDEVDELLFLWVKAVVERLSREDAAAPDPERRAQASRIIARALGTCDRALAFAESRAPWLALRSSLVRLGRGEDPGRPGSGTGPGDEPADVASERSALASFEWARLHFPDGDMGRSLAWMRHAVRLRGDDYWYQYSLAYLEDLAGHPDEALVHYSIAAALQPDNPFVRYSRARLYRSKGKWDDARDDFEVALRGLSRDRPQARMVLLERGILYQTKGDFARARADYDEVIRRDPADDNGRSARLNRAGIFAESGDFARARAEYDALLAEDLRDRVARHSRAILELRLGEASLADRDLSALLDLSGVATKDRVEYLAERAQARLLMNRAAEAVSDACEARRLLRSPANDRLAQRAWLAAGRYDQLEIDRPEDLALWPLRGPRLTAELQAGAAALRPIAAGRDGRAFRAGLTRAVILAALGRSQEARAAATRSAWLSPFSAEARIVLARVLSSGGDRARAFAEVEGALSIHPEHAGLYELRGDLRLAANDPLGALEDFDRAASLGSRDRLRPGKASALLALGRTRAALDEWSLALRRDPELPEAFLGRARTYFLLGDWDLGLADLEQATAWAHADPRIEAAVALGYLQCLRERPDRLPRLLVHVRRAVDGFCRSLGGRYRLTAAIDPGGPAGRP